MTLHRSCKSMWIHTRNRKGNGKRSRKGSKQALKRLYENERCISRKNPCENTAFSHDRWKRLYENTERCISRKNPCENTASSHDGWKRLYENTTMSQARQKGAGKTQHCLQLVHCWKVLWDPRSMSMSKRSPSVIEPLDDMWWCGKKQKFNNELNVYSMYVIIPFFLHKMLASHRQPTFRDRRWTNYSNPGQLYPPRPPNFKVVFFFQGLRRVDKTNQTPQHDIKRTRSLTLTFGEGGVVQSFPRGLNILSIYGTSRYTEMWDFHASEMDQRENHSLLSIYDTLLAKNKICSKPWTRLQYFF